MSSLNQLLATMTPPLHRRYVSVLLVGGPNDLGIFKQTLPALSIVTGELCPRVQLARGCAPMP